MENMKIKDERKEIVKRRNEERDINR